MCSRAKVYFFLSWETLGLRTCLPLQVTSWCKHTFPWFIFCWISSCLAKQVCLFSNGFVCTVEHPTFAQRCSWAQVKMGECERCSGSKQVVCVYTKRGKHANHHVSHWNESIKLSLCRWSLECEVRAASCGQVFANVVLVGTPWSTWWLRGQRMKYRIYSIVTQGVTFEGIQKETLVYHYSIVMQGLTSYSQI